MLYTNEDFASAKRWARMSKIGMAVLIAGIVVAGLIPLLISRNQVLSVVLSTACALLFAFLYGMVFAPSLSYRRYMRQAEEGIRHTFEGEFVGEGDESLRDGVRFIAMSLVVSEDEEPRRVYYDAALPAHGLSEGRRYEVTHTGNSILAISPR